jgi:hypothetical protein
MLDMVSRTALPGRSQSSHDRVARGLGYLSIALGVAEIVAPAAICRAAGVRGLENVVRGYGAREIATGVAILGSHDPEPWIWTRVAGDLADIATVAAGAQRDAKSKGQEQGSKHLCARHAGSRDVDRPGLRQRIAIGKRQSPHRAAGLQEPQRIPKGLAGRKRRRAGFSSP